MLFRSSFDDTWAFSGSVASQYKQIGNAVPVKLAKAVAEEVVNCLSKVEKTAEKMVVSAQAA